MSAAPAHHESESGPSSTQPQRPPRIPKPKTFKHSLSQAVVQQAFEIDYYTQRTNSWRDHKIAEVVHVLRKCCEEPILEHKDEFELVIRGFKHQSENLKNKIYDKFVDNIHSSEISPEFRKLLLDMVESTSEDRWLFIWLVGSVMKGWRGTASLSDQDKLAKPRNLPRVERKSPLGIDDLLN
ncbi:hypothetical protein TWF481_006209 [Arthrobotrys musiformis]|uniref:Uncharacterized protein n=1 Tax=Arthrobotrys musiformis TaxID=47236 RepID=A0AAV9WHM8_9PEZI